MTPASPRTSPSRTPSAASGRSSSSSNAGTCPLEASLGLFEEGIRLARVSQHRLDSAERRIEELLGVNSDGEAVTRPFEAKLDGG